MAEFCMDCSFFKVCTAYSKKEGVTSIQVTSNHGMNKSFSRLFCQEFTDGPNIAEVGKTNRDNF